MIKTITPLVFVGILATASYKASNGGVNQPEAQASANGHPRLRRLTEEDSSPVRNLSEEECKQVARLDGSTTAKGQSGMYDDIPIEFTKQNGQTVEFKVNQEWKDGSMKWLAAMFNDANGEEIDQGMGCIGASDVADSAGPFVAECNEAGVAEVTIFAQDDTFSGLPDISNQIPVKCGLASSGAAADNFALFTFSVPCSTEDINFCEKEDDCEDDPETSEGDGAVDDPETSEGDGAVDGSANSQGNGDVSEAPSAGPTAAPVANAEGSGNTVDTKSTENDGKVSESGGGYGDPHIKTWLGTTYDFHGGCDLVMARSEKFNNGQGLALHVRTSIRRDWSFISTATLKIGEDTFQVGTRGIYYQNNKTGPKMVGSMHLPRTIAGYPILYTYYDSKRHKYEIDMGEKGIISFKVYNEFLAVAINNGHEDDFGDSVGLMGEYHTGKLIMRNGEEATDVNVFGKDWQVQGDEPMLFHTVEGPQQPGAQCMMPPPSKAIKRRLSESMVSYEQAEEACKDWIEEARESCIYDVLATGDLDMAMAGAF